MEVRHDADEYEAKLADVVSVVRDTIRRRWLVLAAVAGTIFVLGVLAVSLLTPQYTATAKVRLDPSRNPLANASPTNTSQVRQDLTPEAIETELTAVSSADIARGIVKAKGLASEPAYAKALANAPPATLANPDLRDGVIATALLGGLTVSREADTYVLDIAYKSPNPVDAAAIANGFADGYLEARASKKVGTAREQSAWFQQRLAQLGKEATDAEVRAAEYRARAGIVESDQAGGTIVDQQVAPLAGSLASAQSDAAAARSSLLAARAQVARGGLDTVSEVLQSPVIAALRGQRVDVLRQRLEVEARYGELHPESIRVRDALANIDSQIKAESQRIVGSLQATSDAAQARVASLQSSLGTLEGQRERSVRDSTQAGSLEQEAAAKRALYDKLSQLSLDSMQAAGAAIAQAEIIERAAPPPKPTSPNKPLLYALALLVALAAGGGTIAAQEMLSGGFRTVEELEAKTGLPVLAVVPKVTKVKVPADLMLDKPTSMFAESFRIARTAILGARGEAGVKVIAITSSLPSEGKTNSAVAFARTLAVAGAKTLLLECDVRRAAVREVVKGGTPKIGLVELLHGEVGLDHVIEPGDVPNLDQILVVEPFFSAENLFGEGRMEKLLDQVRSRYDHIVLDLPPLMGLADGRYLAVLADATALVVKWNSTPVSAVVSALSWLRSDGGKPIGTICTQVDPSAHSVGGLYYYSKQYSDYYQSQ